MPPIPTDFLNHLSSTKSEVLYGETLELQAELHEERNRSFLGSLEVWQKAAEILDAGCGPGNLPARFGDLLDGKRYVGVDRESHFITRARQRAGNRENTRFICSDLFEFKEGPFDIVYLWAVLQHLPSVEEALRHAHGLLRAGGHAVILDSCAEDELVLQPNIPSIISMYDELHRYGNERGRRNDCIEEIKRAAQSCGFQVDIEAPANTIVSSSDAKGLFMKYVLLVSELLERFYSIKTDRAGILKDLESWAGRAGSRVDMRGGRWLVLGAT